jgi:hypothetical protein
MTHQVTAVASKLGSQTMGVCSKLITLSASLHGANRKPTWATSTLTGQVDFGKLFRFHRMISAIVLPDVSSVEQTRRIAA